MKKRILFTGGGTGGHVYPALAVIERMNTDEWEISWLGSSGGMEKAILEKTEIPYFGIPSGKLRRYFSLRNFTDLFRISAGCISSVLLLKKLKPQILFSKGGFVSVPPVLAASLMKIPVFTHDSDIVPGLATRINARFADKILVSSRESMKHFSPRYRDKIVVTGNPVRQSLFSGDREIAQQLTGAAEGKPVILIMGGSLGARQLNDLVYENLEKLTEKYFVIHQTGAKNFKSLTGENYYGVPYFNDELAHIFALSDLVISRAGAGALWEFAAAGLPSLLIPLESGSRGEQVRNGEVFVDKGCSLMLRGEIDGETFLDSIADIVDNKEKLADMKKAAAEAGKLDGAATISAMIEEVVR
ncbi:MAG: undecaprenyldiphospho-muramoylpentapeptide beta-N-acetylglucosaminyltransferase [Spirochaetales bacterium]|nr:undecaprenyldiphospho-muramoylpentapeptide beta-N-acetylglucosaminyltransferase [Spirochaetales bacterium]